MKLIERFRRIPMQKRPTATIRVMAEPPEIPAEATAPAAPAPAPAPQNPKYLRVCRPA